MSDKNTNKMNFVHGIIITLIGLIILIWGPIESRGFLVHRSVGIIICVWGIFILFETVRGRKKQDNK